MVILRSLAKKETISWYEFPKNLVTKDFKKPRRYSFRVMRGKYLVGLAVGFVVDEALLFQDAHDGRNRVVGRPGLGQAVVGCP